MLCQYSNCTFNLVLEKLVEKIKMLPLLKGYPQCPEHGENLKLFSKPDGKLICFQCKDARLSVGQSKDFLQISDAVRFFMVGEPRALNNALGKLGKIFCRVSSLFQPYPFIQMIISKLRKYNISCKVLSLELLIIGKEQWSSSGLLPQSIKYLPVPCHDSTLLDTV